MQVGTAGSRIPPELFPRVLSFFVVNPYPAQLQEQNIRNIVHANKRCLAAIGLTCKYWSQLCQKILFEQISLRSYADITLLLALLDSNISKIASCIQRLICDISCGDTTRPWLHLVPKLYERLPSVTASSRIGLGVTLNISGPLSARYRTIRTIYWSIPRTIPASSSGINILKLSDMHFGSFHDLLRLSQEVCELTVLSCTRVTWGTMPSTMRWKPSWGRQPMSRIFKVTVSESTHNWAAIWLCVAFNRALPTPAGEDILYVGRLVGSLGQDFNGKDSVTARTFLHPDGAISIRAEVEHAHDNVPRELFVKFVSDPQAQHVQRVQIVLPIHQFEQTDWKAFSEAASRLHHLEAIALRFYLREHIDLFARGLTPQIALAVSNKLKFELRKKEKGVVSWESTIPQLNEAITQEEEVSA